VLVVVEVLHIVVAVVLVVLVEVGLVLLAQPQTEERD
jgi:hypothetical protein